jgi:hypothetical protein
MKLHFQSQPIPATQIPFLGQAVLSASKGSADRHLALAAIGEPADLLGRFEYIPSATDAGPPLVRRLTGGCAYRVGRGAWVAHMALPRLEELGASRPRVGASLPLPPPLPLTKLLNRYVRPFMGGLNRLGARTFYPGRDRLRAGDGLLAMVSFHLEPQGAVLFEMLICAAPGSLELSSVAQRLRFPAEALPAAVPFVSLDQLVGSHLPLETFADRLRQHLSSTCGIELTQGPPLPSGPERAANLPEVWQSDCEGYCGVWGCGQLAELWAGVRLSGAVLSSCRVRGAFLGPPATLRSLESSLASAPLEPQELGRRLQRSLGGAEPLLGLGRCEVLIDMIVRASRAQLSYTPP